MIDLRYHVYSLAAVFFALAIGIVIGSSFAGKPMDARKLQRIEDRYERSLDGMKTEVYRQRDDIRAAKGDLDRSEALCASLVPIALKSRLLYNNVAIVETGDYDNLVPKIKESLEAAGAKVTSVTRIPGSFDISDATTVADAVSAAKIKPKDGESSEAAIVRAIADGIVQANQGEKLIALENMKVVSTSGDYKHWNRHVVLVGGVLTDSPHRAQVIDLPLIKRMRNLGATVVACEPLRARTSSVPVWQQTDIATVDDADRISGRVALICALTGENAHFGEKSSADRKIPETLDGSAQ